MRRLVIIDVSNFIFRAFFAIRPLTSPDGVPVNAVYGVLTMLHRLVADMEPTHVLVARDTKEASFRKEEYQDYKANRSDPPDDLVPQFALIEELLTRLRLPSIAMPRYEADDIIGCVVTQFRDDFDEIYIASGDKDLMQFVDAKVKVLDTMKQKIYGPADVEEKMGVPPHQIVDYLALIGDSSDNIPGVPGIGPKGAASLLKEFGTLEACLLRADEVKNKKTQTALKEHPEAARISKFLATIKCDLELPMDLDGMAYKFTPDAELAAFLDRLGFRSFLAKLGVSVASTPTVASAVAAVPAAAALTQTETEAVEWSTLTELKKFLQDGTGPLYIHAEWEVEHDPYSPFRVMGLGQSNTHGTWRGEDSAEIWKALEQLQRPLVAWELKPLWLRFLRHGLELPQQAEDLAQAHFVLAPEGRHDLDTLSREQTGEGLPPLTEPQKDLLDPQVVSASALAAYTRTLERGLAPLLDKLREQNVLAPYRDLDLPLLKVLARMELAGVSLDVPFYATLEKEFDTQTRGIEAEVEKIAGHPVNLKSPKQIAQLLFEDLKLPVVKKTKTGYSTDVDVLETLAAMEDANPIPEMLLRYREVEKLNSTYVRALPKMVNPQDQRIHTTFRPGVAATGRLSSDHPNLQNIPVRTENGRRLRKGFVASPGLSLLSADYSQVELRILAHFSEDPVMLEAFRTDRDIHVQTASEIFGIPLAEVTKDQRNGAKAINFGLMYGQTSFGLSQTLRIPQAQARDYITNYFQRFSRVKAYLDSLKEFAEAHGYAETLFGRKRLLPDIHSSNRQIKAMAERMAINSPIQGTAADIIKLAMIGLDQELRAQKFKARLLLQVHDELILEAPPEELPELHKLVRQKMETAVTLKTPLRVDVGTGTDWYSLK
jgi:DNA polymerase-1